MARKLNQKRTGRFIKKLSGMETGKAETRNRSCPPPAVEESVDKTKKLDLVQIPPPKVIEEGSIIWVLALNNRNIIYAQPHRVETMSEDGKRFRIGNGDSFAVTDFGTKYYGSHKAALHSVMG